MTARRTQWTPALDAFLREHYPHRPTREVAHMLGLRERQIYNRAEQLGLRKSAAYMAQERERANRALTEGGKASRFVKGQTSWNKGRQFDPGGRSHETRFKPGRPAEESRNYRPIGSHRITSGNVERKVSDDPNVYPARRWVPVHRLVWEAAHGPVSEGYVVVFRAGMHTTDPDRITTDRLELVDRAELMRRNGIHAHGPEIARLHQLRGAITRKVRNRQRKAGDQSQTQEQSA